MCYNIRCKVVFAIIAYTERREFEYLNNDRFIRFSSLLNNAQKSLARIKFKKMDSYGLGSAHTLCMCIMRDFGEGITKTELASRCGVDKAQISRLVGNLLDKKYVALCTPQKSYRQRYVLTEEGKRIAGEIQHIAADINGYVSGDISEADLAIFYSTFEKICERLNCAEEKF